MERKRREINPESNYPPIPEIFRSWANNAGYPILNVEFDKESSSLLRVSQELFVPQIGHNSTSEFLIVYSYRFLKATHEDDMNERINWLQVDENEKIHDDENLYTSPELVLFNLNQNGELKKVFVLFCALTN